MNLHSMIIKSKAGCLNLNSILLMLLWLSLNHLLLRELFLRQTSFKLCNKSMQLLFKITLGLSLFYHLEHMWLDVSGFLKIIQCTW